MSPTFRHCRRLSRRSYTVTDDARVDPIPPQLFNEERRILAASRIDEYEETRAALARNRARWVSSRGTAKRSMATGMSVEQLLDGLLVLLDGAPILGRPRFVSAAATVTAPPLAPAPTCSTVPESAAVDADRVAFLRALAGMRRGQRL